MYLGGLSKSIGLQVASILTASPFTRPRAMATFVVAGLPEGTAFNFRMTSVVITRT